MQKTNPNFVIGLGNEIYLTDNRERGQKYYHFILIAKDRKGYEQLTELSSIAWYNVYSDRGLERVPLLKTELAKIVSKDFGHLIATSSCLGGELPFYVNQLIQSEKTNNEEEIFKAKTAIHNFITFCLDLFKNDFYIEVAPGRSKEQIAFNKRIVSIAQAYNVKITTGTDSHYLLEQDRYVHKAYLNSKEGDREVDSFYEYARLMSADEAFSILSDSYEDDDFIKQIFKTTQEIRNKITFYSLEKPQAVPEVKVKDYSK